MALTPSTKLTLGTVAPDFKLLNPATHTQQSLAELASDIATVIMFICNHCPFVKHIADALAEVAKNYKSKGMSFIAINANDVSGYPDDAPEKMVTTAKHYGFTFPYLFDDTQATAKAYQAVCTPEFYVYDKGLKLVYHGQFDDSRPGNRQPISGSDLRNVLDNILEQKPISSDQKPSMGCNIKWKAEP